MVSRVSVLLTIKYLTGEGGCRKAIYATLTLRIHIINANWHYVNDICEVKFQLLIFGYDVIRLLTDLMGM